jgi:hypothetical protein
MFLLLLFITSIPNCQCLRWIIYNLGSMINNIFISSRLHIVNNTISICYYSINYLKNYLKILHILYYIIMSIIKRNGKKWTIPEVLNLQREYELLNLSIKEIAKKHKRSEESILFKLYAEDLTENATLYPAINIDLDKDIKCQTDSSSEYEDDNVSEYTNDDSVCIECNIDKLSDRVWSLETSVEEINTMVKQMFNQFIKKKKSNKLAPLRQTQ